MQSDFYRALERAQAALDPLADPVAVLHAVVDGAAAASHQRSPWACGKGCAACCRFPVGVTRLEAGRLVAALRAHPRSGDLATAVRSEARATRGLPWAELSGRPCPLLLDAACALYESRPLPCRALGSRDRRSCERSADGERVPVPFAEDAFAAGLACGQVLDDASGRRGHRELRSALAALLDSTVASFDRAYDAARAVDADGSGPTATALPAG